MTASRRRMVVIVAVLIVATTVFTIAVWPSSSERNDFAYVPTADANPTLLVDGGQWQAVLDGNCLQFRTEGMLTLCQSVESASGGAAGRVEGRGQRIVWAVWVSPTPVTVRWWSSMHERTEHTSVGFDDGLQLVAFALQPGEDPYGLQVWDSDGNLVWVAAQP